MEKFQANKKFGQHFLRSDKVIEKIVSDCPLNLESFELILEIGPGPGILTKELKQRYEHSLMAIEIDSQFYDFLEKLIHANNLIKKDALEVDYENLFTSHNISSLWLVSNLPYNVAAPLMINFFALDKIKRMTLMMQKEMAERIMAYNPKKQKTNSLFSYAHTFFDVSKLVHVPPGSFDPPPKVDSTVLTFNRKEKALIPLEEYSEFQKFCRHLFSTPRKQLQKVLKTQIPHLDWMNILDSLEISAQIRAEVLELQQVHQLYFAWKRGM